VTTVSVLGAGVMASALAFPLTDNGHEVRLVGTHLDREIVARLHDDGVHPGLGREMPNGVTACQIEAAEEAFADADLVISGVNSFGVRWAGEKLAGLLQPGIPVLSITKGLEAGENGDLRILPDVLTDLVPSDVREGVTWSAIAGPSIAGEVAARRQSCVVFTGRDHQTLDHLAGLFRTDYYHVWTSTDFVGVEVCAALKNCYALGVGFGRGVLESQGEGDGPDQNHDYEAALFGQASVEMGQMARLLGGRPETPHGLAGVGDMYVTSAGGRNVRVGRLVGTGLRFSEAREKMEGVTLEGAAAIEVVGEALHQLTERGAVGPRDFPLMRHLYAVVAKDRPLDMPWETFFGGEA
jgi:glycerol-3-phosphate dehydrogenase (NAD(P)+)